MSKPIDLRNPGRPVKVGVVLMGGETEILDVAPIDVFSAIDKRFLSQFPDEMISPALKAQALEFEFHWVSEAGPEAPAKLTSGIKIIPTHSFETAPVLDIMLVGARNHAYEPTAKELDFIRRCYEKSAICASICGGVFDFAKAGILEGKTATGPLFIMDALRHQYPSVNWVDKRWAHDGKLWTSGALLNGTDMMRNLLTHIWGDGEDSLVGFSVRLGGWPNRDVDYKDEELALPSK